MNAPVTYKRILHFLAPTRKTARSQTAIKHVKSSFRQSRQLPRDQQLKQLEIAQVYANYLKDLKDYTVCGCVTLVLCVGQCDMSQNDNCLCVSYAFISQTVLT